MSSFLCARTRPLIGAVVAASIAVTLAACDKSHTSMNTVTGPTLGSLRSLHLSGPDTLAPGDAGQFTVIGNYLDGTSADVTSQARFEETAGDGLIGFKVDAGGIARVDARSAPGFVKFKAMLNGLSSASWEVDVLSPGTYRLYGAITEDGQADDGSVVVEIIGGTGVGVGAKAMRVWDDPGHYAFFGVAGDLEIRASADGYAPQVHRINVTAKATEDFHLQSAGASADFSGAWTMTVSPNCAAILPASVGERALTVQVVQHASNLEATFSGPTLYSVVDSHHLGKIFGQALSLQIQADDFDTFIKAYLFDKLSSTQFLGISGTLRGTVTEPAFNAVLTGNIDLYTMPAGANFPSGAPVAQCRGEHGVVVRRR